MIPVSSVVNTARGILIDAAKATWSDAVLIGHLNEFARNTAGVKRDLKTVRQSIGLQPGVSQEITELYGGQEVVALLDITRNTTSKSVITQCDKALLDEVNRFWPADDQTTDVDNFSVNVKEPTRFYVTPPNNGYGYVDATLGVVPEAVPETTAGLDTEWPCAEIYQPAAIDYVLARAYAMNTKKQDVVKSDFYMKSYGTRIGLKAQAQIAAVPKTADPPEAR